MLIEDFASLAVAQRYFKTIQTLLLRPIAWVLTENANGSYILNQVRQAPLIHILILTLTIFAFTSLAEACENCLLPQDFVRLDISNKRLFAVISEDKIVDINHVKELIVSANTYISMCCKNWNNKWSVSFFSEEKYVGYKDENEVHDYVDDGSWYLAYLGEYDHAERQLTLFPLEPGKIKKIDRVD